LGMGDWGLGIGPNPQSPIPNPQSPIPIKLYNIKYIILNLYIKKIKKIFNKLLDIIKNINNKNINKNE